MDFSCCSQLGPFCICRTWSHSTIQYPAALFALATYRLVSSLRPISTVRGHFIALFLPLLIVLVIALFSALVSHILRANEPKHALVPVRGASNTLTGLPAELILLISESLEPVDQICFSLCSRWISMVLDGQRRNVRYHISRERLPLLWRLDRDLPDQFVCYECYLLHKYDESLDFCLPHPFDFRYCHPCLQDNLSWQRELLLHQRYPDHPSIRNHIAYRFYFVHLQLAMKRFYCGPAAGISTDSLFSMEVTPTSWITTLFSCEARICCQPPALQLRVQDIVLFHSDQKIKWCEDTLGYLLVCRHQQNDELVSMMKQLANQFFAENKDSYFSNRCRTCNTDYQVELRVFHGGLAFVITRWIDLGSGMNPYDPRWSVHARLIPNKFRKSLDPEHMLHSPRAVFESACGERNSLDHLRSCNLAHLNNGHYKKVMKRGWLFDSRWYLWQKALS